MRGQLEFLCSICIPTHNRADLLRNTLESITSAASFLEKKIEIVISNNASSDHTHAVCEKFQKQFPDQIIYIPLETRIDAHDNYENALNHGTGKFIKLQNDNISYEKGALDRFAEALEKYEGEGNIFLPENHPDVSEEYEIINSVEELVLRMSYQITAISLLCVRSKTYHSLESPFRAWETHFPHVDILFRLLNSGEKAVRLHHIHMRWQRIFYNAGTRNQAQEFAYNYISLLDEQRRAGHLSRKTFQLEKMRTLFKQTIPLHFDFFHQFYDSKKVLPFLPYTRYYRKDWFFYVALFWIAFYWSTSNIIPIHQALGAVKRKIQRVRKHGKPEA